MQTSILLHIKRGSAVWSPVAAETDCHRLMSGWHHVRISNGAYWFCGAVCPIALTNGKTRMQGRWLLILITNGEICRIADPTAHELTNRTYKRHIGCSELYWSIYWANLHWLSANYPDSPSREDKHEMLKLLDGMKTTLPCPECRKHFCHYLTKHGSSFENQAECFRFFVELHNDVSGRLGKPPFDETKAREFYSPQDLPEYCKPIIRLFRRREIAHFTEHYGNHGFAYLVRANQLA